MHTSSDSSPPMAWRSPSILPRDSNLSAKNHSWQEQPEMSNSSSRASTNNFAGARHARAIVGTWLKFMDLKTS